MASVGENSDEGMMILRSDPSPYIPTRPYRKGIALADRTLTSHLLWKVFLVFGHICLFTVSKTRFNKVIFSFN
jgi:hypothetical protein